MHPKSGMALKLLTAPLARSQTPNFVGDYVVHGLTLLHDEIQGAADDQKDKGPAPASHGVDETLLVLLRLNVLGGLFGCFDEQALQILLDLPDYQDRLLLAGACSAKSRGGGLPRPIEVRHPFT